MKRKKCVFHFRFDSIIMILCQRWWCVLLQIREKQKCRFDMCNGFCPFNTFKRLCLIDFNEIKPNKKKTEKTWLTTTLSLQWRCAKCRLKLAILWQKQFFITWHKTTNPWISRYKKLIDFIFLSQREIQSNGQCFNRLFSWLLIAPTVVLLYQIIEISSMYCHWQHELYNFVLSTMSASRHYFIYRSDYHLNHTFWKVLQLSYVN